MASEKDEKKNTVQSNPVIEVPVVLPASVVPDDASAPDVVAVLSPARVFRDNAYTSRMLIMPDGRSIAVSKGQVTAFGDDQFDYLSSHPDLELLKG